MVVLRKSSSRDTMTKLSPCEANFKAMAFPIPDPAPVTSAQVALYRFLRSGTGRRTMYHTAGGWSR